MKTNDQYHQLAKKVLPSLAMQGENIQARQETVLAMFLEQFERAIVTDGTAGWPKSYGLEVKT
jgi:hypothetical protein